MRYLRVVEDLVRGLDREMTQKEVVAAIRRELKRFSTAARAGAPP